jgi:hypothetical protein
MLLASCTKVINVDLNSSNPQYVIEGDVTDSAGPYLVRITRSVNFSEESNYPAVSNALVTISDNGGSTDTLQYSGEGYYQTQHLVGTPGHTYALNVQVDGASFTAVDAMPMPVKMDSLLIEYNTDRPTKPSYYPQPVYRDPAGVQNFYRFIVSLNGYPRKAIYSRTDQLNDGLIVKRTLADRDTTYKAGDALKVEMQCITEPMYKYYQSLSQTIQQNSATPANPSSNISGKGALGYFSAHTVSTRAVVVP